MSYPEGNGKRTVLSHVNLSFPSKGFFCLNGPSGSGKSTLLFLLSGMMRPDSGEVLYRNKPFSDFKKKDWNHFRRHSVGFLFQSANLLDSLTALENIALPLELSGYSSRKAVKKARKSLSAFQLEGKEKQTAGSLSGGEKQRVALLRALASNPEILFCDEPTGALDEKNGRYVMEKLKQESVSRLVIMVSHDLSLSQEYCDKILSLDQGRIPCFEGEPSRLPPQKKRRTKTRMGSVWKRKMVFLHFKQDGWKNFLGFASAFLGFSSLALFAGFYCGSGPALDESSKGTLGYPFARISEKEVVEIPGSPLTLVKERLPDPQEAENFLREQGRYFLECDYSFLVSESHAFSLDEKQQPPCSFSPCLNLSLQTWGEGLLLSGYRPRADTFSSVLVNEAFASTYSSVLGQTISLAFHASFSEGSAYDEIDLECEWTIAGVVREFPFLTSPMVYYSFPGLEKKLDEIPLPEISLRRDEPITVLKFAQEEKKNDTRTSFWLFARDAESASKMEELRHLWKSINPDLSFTSPSLEAREGFSSLSTAFSSALSLFVGLAFLGLVLILGMSSFSNYSDRRKETAILLCLGASLEEVASLYAEESASVGFLGAMISLLFSPLLAKGLNGYLFTQFGIEDLIRIPLRFFLGVPFLLPVSIFSLSLLLPFLCACLPILCSKKQNEKEELCNE